MIRIVLVEEDGHWRTYRQAQWMARVRESPDRANLPRRYFDVPEERYAALLKEGGASDEASAVEAMARHGAVEVLRK